MNDIPINGDGSLAIDWAAELQQHRSWLRKVLRCRVGDCHEVEDLLQEVALAAVRQTAKPVDRRGVAPWLYRLAVRQAINFHRRNGRRSHARPEGDLNDLSIRNDPLDWLLDQERDRIMARAIEQLPAVDREIMTLKYTENWTYQQLAERLGVQPRTIEYRLTRARERLRKLLQQNGGSQ